MSLVVAAVVLVAAAVVLVVVTRRRTVGTAERQVHASGVTGRDSLEAAVAYVRPRLDGCPGLETAGVRRCMVWITDFVRARAVPLNGHGPGEGWLLAPGVSEVAAHVEAEAAAVGLDLDEGCVWQLVSLHDDFLRTRSR